MLANNLTIIARSSICKTCDQLTPVVNICKSCGCFTNMKVILENQTCPLKKW